jgi:hypothetical protein
MKILSLKDKISLKHKDMASDSTIEVILKPFSMANKMEIASKVKIVNGEEVPDDTQQALLSLKYSIVDVKGIKDYSGNDYKLSFDENELIDDQTVDDLLTVFSEQNLLANIYYASNKMLDKIEGVEVSVLPKN